MIKHYSHQCQKMRNRASTGTIEERFKFIFLYLNCIQLQEALQHCLRALPHIKIAEPIPACINDRQK